MVSRKMAMKTKCSLARMRIKTIRGLAMNWTEKREESGEDECAIILRCGNQDFLNSWC
jgi:hypothetical protein